MGHETQIFTREEIIAYEGLPPQTLEELADLVDAQLVRPDPVAEAFGLEWAGDSA